MIKSIALECKYATTFTILSKLKHKILLLLKKKKKTRTLYLNWLALGGVSNGVIRS